MNRIVTSFGSAGDDAEELGALRRRDARGRLVEQQDPRPRRERQRDLDEALPPVGQVARERIGVGVEPQRAQQRTRFVDLVA